jgi:hypothetical protein
LPLLDVGYGLRLMFYEIRGWQINGSSDKKKRKEKKRKRKTIVGMPVCHMLRNAAEGCGKGGVATY